MADKMMRMGARGKDGLAKALKANIEGDLSVSVNETKDYPTQIYFGDEEIIGVKQIISTSESVAIDDLMIGTSDKRLKLTIVPRDKAGALISSRFNLSANGQFSRATPSFEEIQQTGYSYVNLEIYNEHTKEFFIRLKEPVIFPFGVLITIRNDTTETIKAGAILNHRKLVE